MDKLKKLTLEYLALTDRCDGTSETFAAISPLAEDLEARVEKFRRKTKDRAAQYLALKLFQDVSNFANRIFKYYAQAQNHKAD